MATWSFMFLAVISLLHGSLGLTPSVRNAFVNHFNDVRSTEAVAEHASDMWKMAWDTTLETQSQKWVDNCKFEHSHTAGVSEVIYVSSTQADTFENYAVKAIDAWMGEKKFNADKSFSCCGTTCGHYCQTVKDVNVHVGCGIKKCSPVTSGVSYAHGTIVVCQFKAQGTAAPHIYNHGAPCSACGANTHCVNHLCVHGPAPVGR